MSKRNFGELGEVGLHQRRSGTRVLEFRNFIFEILRNRTSLSDLCARMLVCDRYTKTWDMAFTHSSFDAVNNYKMLEQCGDAVIHHFIKNHILERFPHFRRFPAKYVGVVENINQRCVSRAGLSVLARDLGFGAYVSYDNSDTAVTESGGYTKPLSQILEDTFEAFVGALEMIVDDHIGTTGAGFAVCCEFLHDLFTTHPKFADLQDRVRHIDVYPAKTIILEFSKDPNLKNVLGVEFACTRKRGADNVEKTAGRFPTDRAPGERSTENRAPGKNRSSNADNEDSGGVFYSECILHMVSDFGTTIQKTFFGEDRCKKPAEELAASRTLRFLVELGILEGTKYMTNYADPSCS